MSIFWEQSFVDSWVWQILRKWYEWEWDIEIFMNEQHLVDAVIKPDVYKTAHSLGFKIPNHISTK